MAEGAVKYFELGKRREKERKEENSVALKCEVVATLS